MKHDAHVPRHGEQRKGEVVRHLPWPPGDEIRGTVTERQLCLSYCIPQRDRPTIVRERPPVRAIGEDATRP
jgi:hypothetical protein